MSSSLRRSRSLDQLLGDLQRGDEFARAQAAFTLAMLGAPAVQPLVSMLSLPDREVRMRAAWALSVIGASAVPALLELAHGAEKALRVEAIRVLGTIGEGRAIEPLLGALVDEDAAVASRAARALGKMNDVRVFHPLLTALGHPSPDVRYEACRSLGDLRQPDAVVALRVLARNDQGQTSWGAAVADTARQSAEILEEIKQKQQENEFVRVSALLLQRRAWE
jgi:HEAT repeat protein